MADDLADFVERLLFAIRRAGVWATPVAPTRIEVAAGTQESIRTVRFVADDDARLLVEWCHDGTVIGSADDPARVARAIRAVVAS